MKKYISILFFSLAMFGCKDFLAPENKEQLTEESFWQNADQVREAIVAAYGPLQAYNGSKWTFFEQMYIGLAWKSDDILNAPTDYGKAIADFTNGTDDVTFTSFWRSNYAGIFYANQIIENVPNIAGLSDGEKTAFIAEGKFLRAFYHFQLLVAFENIPLVTSVARSSDDFFPEQSTPEQVWGQIEQDLKDAKAGLPASQTGNDTGRATKYTAGAYLGKAHLFQEEWSNASSEFGDVISNGGYALLNNYADNFNGAGENGSESVFEIQWSGNRENGNDERHPFNFEVTPGALGGWELYYPSDWLLDEMKTDLTATSEFSERVYSSVFFDDPNSTMEDVYTGVSTPYADVKADLNHPKYFKKYTGQFDRSYYNGINIHLMRYADVLLMQAEALNEQNQTPAALDLVNEVRQRSNAADLVGLDKDQLRQQIRHHERPIEFAMEYTIRWFDLYRWAKGSVAPEKISETMKAHNKPFADNYVDGKHDTFPIPFSEISKNRNLDQNDGFK